MILTTHTRFSSQAHQSFIFDHGVWHKMIPERASLIYLLGILRVTREHIREIIDFENDEIQPECLSQPWVTPLARRTIMLAFNLYTNWTPDEYPEDCSPSALFDNDKIREFMLEGLQIRYREKP